MPFHIFFTPLYKPYRHELISYPDLTLFYTLSLGRGRSGYEIRHEPLQRVSFFAPFWSELISSDLRTDTSIDFAHFGLESGMGLDSLLHSRF